MAGIQEWSSSQLPYQKNQGTSADTNQSKRPPNDNPSVFLAVGAWANARHDAIEAISAIVSAFFAFVLTGSTIGLWIVTGRAANAAKAAADDLPRVERAYLFTGVMIRVGPGRTGDVNLLVLNVGKTPGFLESMYGEFSEIEPTKETGTGALYSTDVVLSSGERLENPPIFQAADAIAKYFYGHISYRDIFKKSHTSRFCLHVDWSSCKAIVAGPLEMRDFD
ncbi:MAG: hypothetical protein KGJ90_00145 [Patescibacteria group bacterium]|nr:hypothetical protein [Patescibacteria group bacterium]